MVLMEFAWYADPDGANAYPSNETVARNLRFHRNTGVKATKALVAAGELEEAGRKG